MENIEEVIANLKAEVAQQRTIINKLLRTCLEAQTSEQYGTDIYILANAEIVGIHFGQQTLLN